MDVASTVQTAVSNTGYLADNAARVTITLPASPALGDLIQVNGVGLGGWLIAPNPGQSIITETIPNISLSPSTTGSINGGQYDAVELQYVGNDKFLVLNYAGNIADNGYVSEGGLTWMPISATTYTQAAANTLCTSTINGLTGWRLPTQPELSALNSTGAAVGQGWAFAFTWSSTPGDIAGYHYVVELLGGNHAYSSQTVMEEADTGGSYVTCVHSGAMGATGPGITWVDVTSTAQTALSNTGYLADNAAQVTITLPAYAALGDVIQVNGVGLGGWLIVPNPGQSIITETIPNISLSPSTTGSINGGQYDAVELQYVGNNTFSVLSYAGNIADNGYVSEGGLTWMPISATTYTQAAANTLCTTTINGLTGWRLPTQPELSALNSTGAAVGQGWELAFTWSSTPGDIAGYHYVVELLGGNHAYSNQTVMQEADTGGSYVTCVR